MTQPANSAENTPTAADVSCEGCPCEFAGLPTVDTMLTIIGDNGHETNH